MAEDDIKQEIAEGSEGQASQSHIASIYSEAISEFNQNYGIPSDSQLDAPVATLRDLYIFKRIAVGTVDRLFAKKSSSSDEPQELTLDGCTKVTIYFDEKDRIKELVDEKDRIKELAKKTSSSHDQQQALTFGDYLNEIFYYESDHRYLNCAMKVSLNIFLNNNGLLWHSLGVLTVEYTMKLSSQELAGR